MRIKGFDALQRRVPALRASGTLVWVVLAFAAVFTATTLFFVLVDQRFSEWMPDGEIVILALGFLILSRFFSQRENYRRRFGDSAYGRAFISFAVPGLGIIAASVAHLGYMAGPQIPPLWWVRILIALGWLSVATGVVLWVRALHVFGLDSLALFYVYFPTESRLTNSSIYSLVRHPIYAALLDVGFGLALIHASWYSLLVWPVLVLFLFGWVRLVEEKELLTRFPDYADYRRRVPAFWPRPRALLKFYTFILTGK